MSHTDDTDPNERSRRGSAMSGTAADATATHVIRNRQHWESQSADYQSRNRPQLNRWDDLAWGPDLSRTVVNLKFYAPEIRTSCVEKRKRLRKRLDANQ